MAHSKNKSISLKKGVADAPQKANGKIKLSNGVSPDRPMFNFSFMIKRFDTASFEYEENYRKLVEKIVEMSQMSLVELLGRRRDSGLECLHMEDFHKKFSLRNEFVNSHRSNLVGDDYWIFRISKQARVLTKRTDTLFYIIAIDEKHQIYKGK